MSRISRILFKSLFACAASGRMIFAFAPTKTSPTMSPTMVARQDSRLAVSNSLNLNNDPEYVQLLEDTLISISHINDDDLRRNSFESFVNERVQKEIDDTESSAVEQLKLKSLDFVQAMDKSILKLGQSAQDQGWERHVVSGFQPVSLSENLIWPYVDMLIQFKLLISNMERMSYKKAPAPVNTGNGCKRPGCPGLGSCKDGKNIKADYE